MIKNLIFSGSRTGKPSDFTDKSQPDCQEILDAFSRTTYSSVYVIDCEKQVFDYVSENPLFLCGLKADEVKELGGAFYARYVPKEDLDLLLKINKKGFDFFKEVPINERVSYTISYDFQLKPDNKRAMLVNHKITPFCLTQSGDIWKAICVVSLSAEKSSGNIKISKQGDKKILQYHLKEDRWTTVENINLSDRELEIIQLSVRGFTINEIASETFVSPETIKFHRKKIFNKMGVTNMVEASFYAVNNKLL
ncbi:MAG: response regulator transcription factor [Chryseobacterium sp.]|nr:MAG: response regulator transcription factor [Chryseobacterium sp.]